MAASLDELQNIDDIGPIAAQEIQTFFADEVNHEMMWRLKAAGVNFKEEEKVITESVFTGKVCVITGTLSDMSRDEAKEILAGFGANVTGSVRKKTDFLIAGEKAGSNLTKAENLGVTILDEAAFKQMISS